MMDRENVNRREFHKLTAAAMGGLMAGSFVGCAKKKGEEAAGKTENQGGEAPAGEDAALAAWTGKHVCRGLNACKGEGKGSNNECAGKGECATVEPHSCGGLNTCKNLGGCGETAGQNSCKGEGGCQVPLMESAYATAYKKFKADMEKAGKAELLPKEPPGPPKE
jgi:hypothetical protein